MIIEYVVKQEENGKEKIVESIKEFISNENIGSIIQKNDIIEIQFKDSNKFLKLPIKKEIALGVENGYIKGNDVKIRASKNDLFKFIKEVK